MEKIKKIYYLLINLLLYWFTQLIPKNKNLWVFGAWFGQQYNDNPKAFFEYINQHQKHIDAIWISKSSAVIKHVRSLGFKAYHEKSIFGMWCQLRAKFVFVCQSLHDDTFSPCIGYNTQVIQLWHGIPLKKIMFDVFGDHKKTKNVTGKLFDWLSPYNKHRNDIVIATSELTKDLLAKAFRIPSTKVLECGFPRNDVFYAGVTNIKNDKFKCIYMPTFRGGIASECDLFERYGFNAKDMEIELSKHNIQLTLRMHPVNTPPPKIIEQIKNSTVIKLDSGGDIYQSINQYDCLITDYSSIYFDFLLSNKPIVFAPFDLEEYKERERDLYFEFEDATLKPYCYSWSDILVQLIALKNNNISTEYKKQYFALKDKFHSPPLNEVSPFSRRLYNNLISLNKDIN